MDSLVLIATSQICTFNGYLVDFGRVGDAEHEEEGTEACVCLFYLDLSWIWVAFFDLLYVLAWGGTHFFSRSEKSGKERGRRKGKNGCRIFLKKIKYKIKINSGNMSRHWCIDMVPCIIQLSNYERHHHILGYIHITPVASYMNLFIFNLGRIHFHKVLFKSLYIIDIY